MQNHCHFSLSRENMFSLPLLLLFSLSTLTNGLRIDFDLVHRDSALSPFHNSSSTLSDLARNIRLRSQIRSRRRRRLLQTDLLAPVVDEGEGEYLMRIYMGSPPLETWAIADTGSDLIWVQCSPCNNTCYPQNSPIFNPDNSSTYKILSCNTKPCTLLGRYSCGNSSQCLYRYGYADGSTTYGELARNFFSFSGKHASFNNSLLVFGCGHNNSGIFSSQGSGLVGLGAGPLSLVSQLGSEIGHKFSYCLVPYFSNSTSKLKLGEGANISGSTSHGVVTTPFITGGGNYFLTLEGVTVGNKTVETSPKREGNTLIDSGATWFLMEPGFYVKIEALVKDSIGVEEVENASDLFNLCYSNKDAESIMNRFPDLVVHFKGADVYLKPDHNIFFPQDDFICLAIFPLADESGFDYGSMPQVNFQVEHDLEAKQISFAPVDCSKHE